MTDSPPFAGNLTWPLPQQLQQLDYSCSGIAPSLTIKVSGFVDPVISAGAARYQQIFFAYGTGAAPPTPSGQTISTVNVKVTTNDTALRFGIDESYSLLVNGSVASVSAATPFGALWGLETLSQLISRVYTTNAAGAYNGSYYQMCPISVNDAPRFPYRGACSSAVFAVLVLALESGLQQAGQQHEEATREKQKQQRELPRRHRSHQPAPALPRPALPNPALHFPAASSVQAC